MDGWSCISHSHPHSEFQLEWVAVFIKMSGGFHWNMLPI